MIVLDANKSLLIKLDAVPSTQLPIKVSYNNRTSSALVAVDSTTQTNSTSDVTIVSAPSVGSTYEVKQFNVYNISNATQTVTIEIDVSGVQKVVVKSTLAVDEVLQYNDGEGVSILRNSGDRESNIAQNLAISAGTNSYSSGAISFANSNNVSFGITNNSQLTASWYANTVAFWEPPAKNMNVFAVNTVGASTYMLSLQRVFVPYYLNATRLDMIVSIGMNTATNVTISGSFALYTRSASSLSLASSVTDSLSYNSVNQSSAISGFGGNSFLRLRSYAANWSITPGEYWFANAWSVSNNGASSVILSLYGQSSLPIQGVPGGNNDTIGLNGVYSASTTALPSSMNLTDIVYCHSSSNSSVVSYVYRQPHFALYGSF